MNFKCNNSSLNILNTNEAYPVGTLIITTKSDNPSTYIKTGTWELVKKGVNLVGVDPDDTDFNTVGKTGGSKTCELRALIGAYDNNAGAFGYAIGTAVPGIYYDYGVYMNNVTPYVIDNNRINHHTQVLRSDNKEPTTVQPYMVAYIWKRIK